MVMDKVTSRRGWTSMVALEMAVFTWFTEVIIIRGDGEVLLGLGEGADDVGEAGKEPAVKVHRAEQSLDVEL